MIQGSLLQLGDVVVRRRANEDMQEDMEITTTTVLKLQIYRDEVGSVHHFPDQTFDHMWHPNFHFVPILVVTTSAISSMPLLKNPLNR